MTIKHEARCNQMNDAAKKRMPYRIVSGSWPPDICGVGDFSEHLAGALEARGYGVARVRLGPHSVWTALRLILLSWFDSGSTILQYPTEGYGYSVLPFFLALGRPSRTILYCHEYVSKNRYCRWLLRRFKKHPRLLFGNHFDMSGFITESGLVGKSRAGWRVTGIPSNIPLHSRRTSPLNKISPTICYFGQIRPGKALEGLLGVFEHISSLRPKWRIRLIGGVPKNCGDYANRLIAQFKELHSEVITNGSATEVSEALAGSDIFMALFPGGACERRGSLIAAMDHGLLCFTNAGDRTPATFHEMIFLYTGPVEANAHDIAMWLIDNVERMTEADVVRIRERMQRHLSIITFDNLANMVINENS
jgi:glycosyltransferase involved in cell wall biosynthesis